jgi:hypothetical protein
LFCRQLVLLPFTTDTYPLSGAQKSGQVRDRLIDAGVEVGAAARLEEQAARQKVPPCRTVLGV